MQLSQRQEMTRRQRLRLRLFYLAQRDTEWMELGLAAFAGIRAALLYWPPFELSILGFYQPLVNRTQLLLWAVLAIASFAGWLSGWHPLRLGSLLSAIFLWAFSAVITFQYAESKVLALTPAVYVILALVVLLRLALRRARG